ncbi:MAG TPA: hypothetical protein VHJ69_01705 [Gemmatimonadales bacterium]|nr:hypothetical protein [Gemmatimonadales bacterium]
MGCTPDHPAPLTIFPSPPATATLKGPTLGDLSPELELDPSDRKLVRAIGTRALAASAVNLTVGGGIFVLPAVVAGQLGAGALAAYAVCAVAMTLVLLCYAEAGSRVASSGGASVVRTVALAMLLGGLVWLNIRGVRQGARAVELLTLIKLVPLVALVLFGLVAVAGAPPSIELPTPTALGAASLAHLLRLLRPGCRAWPQRRNRGSSANRAPRHDPGGAGHRRALRRTALCGAGTPGP